MKIDTIGKYIKKYRKEKKMRQDDLAEKAGLSTNYISMIERGEKIPSLETFITIANVLGVSADMILCDVINVGYRVKYTMLTEKVEKLPEEDRNRIYDVIDTLLRH